ncbi:hypothetical protein H4Q32_019466 [Labeo rohita]|uniref:Diablo homolog, mitochondrial n=1 Tax=Labeo rohita TaxID=84645 RepID=A0ABQ8LLS8_LABRO|nr:hypothetical protein H4Q32_019466 [Labeo rohita]
MAAYRRKLFAAGLRHLKVVPDMSFVIVLHSCAASLINRSSCQSGRRLAVLPTLLKKNWMTLSVTGALCAVPFFQKPENLSHEELVRRASSLVTDSANTYLSQTTLALLDSLTSYVKAVNHLVNLHKRYVASVSKLSPTEENAFWQVILRQRADQATVTAQNSRQLAQSQVEQVRQLIPETERQLKDSKAEHSVRLQNALSTAMEDEDIPDAYLRED